ncbi:glycosyltransferase family 4 protein [Actinoplanes sp. NPDC051411]|uniref:glycosyltransferase family 4 protein n=1 Tax=Actinoplanes sp. NPDC051411 TaxID=3155522 RepID=UPI00343CEE67
MRILMLSTNYHPVIGGAESYCRDLAAGLAGRGHQVTVFTDGSSAAEDSTVCEEGGVTVVRERSYLAHLSGPDVSTWEQMAFGLLPAVSRSIDLAGVDVIHANSQDTALLGTVLKLQHDIPLVVTSHEVQRERGPAGAGRCRLVFEHLPVDAHIAVSAYYENVARNFGAVNLRRIDLGVDLSRFTPAAPGPARRRLGIGPDEIVLTCIARFKQRKGLLELIEATRLVADAVPQLRVLLVGTTSSGSQAYAASMRRRIGELDLTDRVQLIEDCGHDQIAGLLHASDVYVQPSHVEGLGMAALEAMACGVPVVASDTDGLREAVQPGISGLLAPVGEPAALADVIRRLLGDRHLRERLIAGGLARVQALTVERMVVRTEALYQSLITRSVGRPIVEETVTGLVLAGEGRAA